MDADTERALENLAAVHPLARLKAVHALGEVVRVELERWVDQAELEQVRAARKLRTPATWQDIGRALGVSHTQAMRRFRNRL